MSYAPIGWLLTNLRNLKFDFELKRYLCSATEKNFIIPANSSDLYAQPDDCNQTKIINSGITCATNKVGA